MNAWQADRGLTPGTLLDGFEIGELLHHGRMASIWRARRRDVPFPVAVKVPHLTNAADPAAIAGFEVEHMILPRLSGRHVPRFVAAGDLADRPYLAMELIEGSSLPDPSAGPLPAETGADLGARLADALHDLHRQEVIHLDLAADNVVFRRDGEAVLLDFGFSRHARLPDLVGEEFRRPLGTAACIAPEQVLGVRDDRRSDIFALGVILYALATGRLPFGDQESLHALRRRLYEEPVPPRSHVPSCPRWFQEIILRCLEIDASFRYESAAELALALRNPEQVALTARADRGGRGGLLERMARRLRGSLVTLRPHVPAAGPRRIPEVTIVMAAVDVAAGSEALAEALRLAVLQLVENDASARLTCVTVHRLVPGSGLNAAEGGRGAHVQRLVELKHWARPLGLPTERVTFHVLDAQEPAAALVEYARANHVDHIVIGARASSALRRYLGSVSARVAAEAPCTVTVVRAAREEGGAPPAVVSETREGGL